MIEVDPWPCRAARSRVSCYETDLMSHGTLCSALRIHDGRDTHVWKFGLLAKFFLEVTPSCCVPLCAESTPLSLLSMFSAPSDQMLPKSSKCHIFVFCEDSCLFISFIIIIMRVYPPQRERWQKRHWVRKTVSRPVAKRSCLFSFEFVVASVANRTTSLESCRSKPQTQPSMAGWSEYILQHERIEEQTLRLYPIVVFVWFKRKSRCLSVTAPLLASRKPLTLSCRTCQRVPSFARVHDVGALCVLRSHRLFFFFCPHGAESTSM